MSKNLSGCFSHNSDDWRTPSDLFNLFMDNGFVDCFPYLSKFDQYKKTYRCKRLFINPPYSDIANACRYAVHQWRNGNFVALLIPCRMDTKYFQSLIDLHPYIFFFKGRLKFNDSKGAPFPSCLVIFPMETKVFFRRHYDGGDFYQCFRYMEGLL